MRDRRWWRSLAELPGEWRRTARSLASDRLFATVVILTLALGIGANTAIFVVVKAIWLRPLPVRDPGRLAVFYSRPLKGSHGPVGDSFSWDALRALQRGTRSLVAVTAEGNPTFDGRKPRVSLRGGEPLTATAVSSEYFQVLGVGIQGRAFSPGDDLPGAPPVAIISHDLWTSRFGSDPRLVGRAVRLSDRETVIIGVAARGFRGPRIGDSTDLWLPLHVAGAFLPSVPLAVFLRSPQLFMPLRLYGRLREGASVAEVQTEVSPLASPRGSTTVLRTLAQTAYPLQAQETAGLDRHLVGLLTATAMLVLLAGCMNLAALLLARAERRRPEVAVRVALGISRGRLVRLLATECILLAGLGGIAALGVAACFLRTLTAFSLPTGIALATLDLSLDWRVLAFAAAMSFIAMISSGVAPVWKASRVDPASALSNRSSGSARSRGRSLLLAGHVAFTLMLLIGAVLFTESVRRAFATDLGFERDRTVFVVVTPNLARYANAAFTDIDLARWARDCECLRERLRALPGVRAVTEGRSPLWNSVQRSGGVAPQAMVTGGLVREVRFVTISGGPDYFATLGVPLLAGRDFAARDVLPDAGPVAIVSDLLARELWPGQTAMGRRFSLEVSQGSATAAKGHPGTPSSGAGTASPSESPEIEVIGVASLSAHAGIRGPALFTLYRPDIRNPQTASMRGPRGFAIGTAISARALLPAITTAVRNVFPDAYQMSVATAEQEIATQMMRERMGASLLSWFSAIAFALCLTGVWGLVAYSVARRRTEIAVRLALGAPASRLVGRMAWAGAGPVAAGCLAGVAGSAAATRLVAAYLFGITPLDPIVFAGCSSLVLAVSALAALLPAMCVYRFDPAEILRTS